MANRNIRTEKKYVDRRMRFGLERNDARSPVRSRSEKPRRVRAPLPTCPNCGAQTSVIDMKHNDKDEFGQLYENYRCPVCPCWFTITYCGPDDTYDWVYDSWEAD
jgi:hypothetical protein